MKKAIVIGGGIAGCSTAYALAQRRINVTLIEQHQNIAQEGSGNPVAMLYPKFNTGTSMLSQFAQAGFTYTTSLLKRLPSQSKFYEICGQIQLAFSVREQQKQQALIANRIGEQPYQLLTAAALSEIANLELSHDGLYLPDAGWVKPQAFCHALLNAHKIEVCKTRQALSIKAVNNGWKVHSKEQGWQADIVVICSANHIHQFEQCSHIPITPVKGQVNFFPPTAISKKLGSVICTDHYLSPAVDGLHSVGTSYAPNDLDPSISAEDTQANLLAVKKICAPILNSIDQQAVSARVAWRSATRDYLPLAGQLVDDAALRRKPPRYNDNPDDLPWIKGLYVNAGHGSKGMISAPLCAELIANQVFQEPFAVDQTMASRLNPSRFLLRDLGLKKMAQNLFTF